MSLSHKSLPVVFRMAKTHPGPVIVDPRAYWEVVFSVQGFSDGRKGFVQQAQTPWAWGRGASFVHSDINLLRGKRVALRGARRPHVLSRRQNDSPRLQFLLEGE